MTKANFVEKSVEDKNDKAQMWTSSAAALGDG
jgi:hypothetical protein